MDENIKDFEFRKIIIRYIILILLFLLFFSSLPFAHDSEALLFDKVVHTVAGIVTIWQTIVISIKNYRFYKK